jgi:hypothetical protein
MLCHKSHSDPLKLTDYVDSIEAASVRAGCRQVIDVVGIVVESAFRADNGRLVGFDLKFHGKSSDFNGLPL